MVENSVLQRALWQRLQQQGVELISPARLQAMQPGNGGWQLTLENGDRLLTKLVVGADGANSQVRQLAGMGIRGWNYAQSCMLISVRCEQDAGDCTWQQFTPDGPRAFLPLFDRWASLVWYDSPARIRQLQAMNMAQLGQQIATHFPARLGKVTPVSAGSFPLVRRHATRYVLPGLALVGDAAHTINPLAGQGVNLGYRDVDALIDTLVASRDRAENWASEGVLKRYQRKRQKDNLLMQSGMDLFYFAFSTPVAPLRIVRNLGLMVAERSGVLKRQALKYALGL
jgi:2-octaprenyl-3-methyl-6-methoxy-1,4-benzoquinol hydroxylase